MLLNRGSVHHTVAEAIIEGGDIPIGMNISTAADEEKIQLSKSLIEHCDYYALIITDQCDDLHPDQTSYTEEELEHAQKKGIPILAMVNENCMKLSVSGQQREWVSQQELEQLLIKVSAISQIVTWRTKEDVRKYTRRALENIKQTSKRPGWIKGDQQTLPDCTTLTIDLQRKNNELQKRIDELISEMNLSKELAGLENEVTVRGTYQDNLQHSVTKRTFSIDTSFGELFALIAPHLISPELDANMPKIMAKVICGRHRANIQKKLFLRLDDEIFQGIKIQFMALGLISLDENSYSLNWSITELGQSEMIKRRAVKIE